MVFAPSSLLNLRLSKLDSTMFQLPRYSFLSPSSTPLSDLPSPSFTALQQNSHFSSTLSPLPSSKQTPFGVALRSFDFAVPSAEAYAEAARLKGDEKTTETLERAAAAWTEYVEKAEAAKSIVVAQEAEREKTLLEGLAKIEGELKVTPLGTGSAVPSKYRNVSSTLLHLPRASPDAEQEYILLDAGEGTWGQIARRFGEGNKEKGEPSKEEVLRGIKMLFISHLHQDHHAGMVTILRERVKVRIFPVTPSSPLLTFLPPSLGSAQPLSCIHTYHRLPAQRSHLPLRATTTLRPWALPSRRRKRQVHREPLGGAGKDVDAGQSSVRLFLPLSASLLFRR